jgi:3-oxoadipate enol-lactonase
VLPSLILIHGFPLDRRMWQAQFAGLSDVAEVHAVNCPGFGDAPLPSNGWTVDGMADAIADTVTTNTVPTPLVVGGLSMGGYVALAFARRHPHMLRGLILADTRAEADSDDTRGGRDRAAEAVRKGGTGVQVEAMLPKVFAAGTLAEKPEVVAEFRAVGNAQSPEAVVAALAALRDRPDARPGVGAITVPTLVLVGAEDAVTPLAVAEQLAAGIAGARLIVIPAAGHFTAMENPAAFNAAVREFLQSLT